MSSAPRKERAVQPHGPGLSHLNFNIFYAANQQIFMDGYSKKLKPQRIFAVNTIQNLPS
jgi:hypothetical protein